MDIAVLGISTEINGVVEADRALDSLAGSATQAERAAQRLMQTQAAADVSANKAAISNTRLANAERQVTLAAQGEAAAIARATTSMQANAASAATAAAANNNLGASALRGAQSIGALSTALGFGLGSLAIAGVTFLADEFIRLATEATPAEKAVAALNEEIERTAEIIGAARELTDRINFRRLGEDAEFAADPFNRFAAQISGARLALDGTVGETFIASAIDVTQSVITLSEQLAQAEAERDEIVRRAAARSVGIGTGGSGLGVDLGAQDRLNELLSNNTQRELIISLGVDTEDLDEVIEDASRRLQGVQNQQRGLAGAINEGTLPALFQGFQDGGLAGAAQAFSEQIEQAVAPVETAAEAAERLANEQERAARAARIAANEARRNAAAIDAMRRREQADQDRINRARAVAAGQEARAIEQITNRRLAAQQAEIAASGNVVSLIDFRRDREIASVQDTLQTALEAISRRGLSEDEATAARVAAEATTAETIAQIQISAAARTAAAKADIENQRRAEEIAAEAAAASEAARAAAQARRDALSGPAGSAIAGVDAAFGLLERADARQADFNDNGEDRRDAALNDVEAMRQMRIATAMQTGESLIEIERETAEQIAAIRSGFTRESISVDLGAAQARLQIASNLTDSISTIITAGFGRDTQAARIASGIMAGIEATNAIVQTAGAVTQALPNIPRAIAVGAAGAAQVAIIARNAIGNTPSVPSFTSGLSGGAGGSFGGGFGGRFGGSGFSASTSANIQAPQFGNRTGDVVVNITNNTPDIVTQTTGPNGEIDIVIERARAAAVADIADQMETGNGRVGQALAVQTGGRAVAV